MSFTWGMTSGVRAVAGPENLVSRYTLERWRKAKLLTSCDGRMARLLGSQAIDAHSGMSESLRLAEDLGFEGVDFGLGTLPGVQREPGLAAGLLQEFLAPPAAFVGDLRQ